MAQDVEIVGGSIALAPGAEVALASGTTVGISGTPTVNATLTGTAASPVALGALTDRSGTVTSGGSAQTIAAANAARRYFIIQNHSDTDLWLNFGVAAVANQPSFKIAANGGTMVFEGSYIPTGLVSIIGATTGKAFTAKEA